jgi:crossover junction endodeoxyribonuclease RuvC
MIILGVDPGSHATGYGVIATGEPPRVLQAGVIRPCARDALPLRLKSIFDGICAVQSRHGPAEMAVESLFNARNARSSLILGHARGVVLLAGALQATPVAEYAPREIKKALTGNGAASKEQVRFMVARCLGCAAEKLPLDQSDALAVALCHAFRSRLAGLLPARGGLGR